MSINQFNDTLVSGRNVTSYNVYHLIQRKSFTLQTKISTKYMNYTLFRLQMVYRPKWNRLLRVNIYRSPNRTRR